MPLRSSRSHPQPNHAGGGRAHGLCARALGYSSLPCKRGGPRGRPGRVAAWARAHPCATFSSKKVDETGSAGETVRVQIKLAKSGGRTRHICWCSQLSSRAWLCQQATTDSQMKLGTMIELGS